VGFFFNSFFFSPGTRLPELETFNSNVIAEYESPFVLVISVDIVNW